MFFEEVEWVRVTGKENDKANGGLDSDDSDGDTEEGAHEEDREPAADT